jgi:hypothetical protein
MLQKRVNNETVNKNMMDFISRLWEEPEEPEEESVCEEFGDYDPNNKGCQICMVDNTELYIRCKHFSNKDPIEEAIENSYQESRMDELFDMVF